MTYPKLRVSRLVGESVVNAVLLKLCLELYQSRYNPSVMNINKDTIHMATTSKLSTPLSLGVISLTINVNMDTNN